MSSRRNCSGSHQPVARDVGSSERASGEQRLHVTPLFTTSGSAIVIFVRSGRKSFTDERRSRGRMESPQPHLDRDPNCVGHLARLEQGGVSDRRRLREGVDPRPSECRPSRDGHPGVTPLTSPVRGSNLSHAHSTALDQVRTPMIARPWLWVLGVAVLLTVPAARPGPSPPGPSNREPLRCSPARLA